jgi:hypothetical protein
MTLESMFPNAAICPSCSSATRPGEMFCGVCGARVTAASVAAVPPAPVAAVPPAPVEASASAQPAKSRNTARVALVVAAVVAVAAGIGVLAANDAGAHGQLSDTRKTLATTEATLASTTGQLNTTKRGLASTKADLASANSARARVHNELVSTQRELAGVRGNLSDTQNQLNLQAGQFEIVKTCLNGVATAFSADLDGYYDAALAALNSVESACDQAFSYFG